MVFSRILMGTDEVPGRMPFWGDLSIKSTEWAQ